jgi:hypothetical protein
MQSHSMPELEIESVQSHQRPDADMYQPDSGNQAMVRGRGLNPRTHLLLELGSQQHRGQAYDQRRGDRSEQPPSPAGSKRNHRRKDATAGARAGWLAGVGSYLDYLPYPVARKPSARCKGEHDLTPEQRQRWIALLLETADRQGLPDDPEFVRYWSAIWNGDRGSRY